ncbi:hypothetical protein B0H16DRAFT_1694242 [Mycena metata]|uniref:Uncharacterized protein n=1 Tax=Mycena metata TaxID=1033252 RepID=A0AAD7N016_9AGAR|nr:hypothetical protein B0H16DRAFT_1694242 [Mycena metata]
MVLLSLGAGIFVAYLVPSLRVLHPLQTFGADTVRIVEREFLEEWTWAASNLSALATHIPLHGRQYAKIILLALASHFACITLRSPVRRMYRHMHFLGRKLWETVLVVVVVPWSVIVAIPQLRWIFWTLWYFGAIPTTNDINQNILRIPRYLSFLAANQPVDTMILGPATIHAAIICLSFLLPGVYRIPGITIRCLFRRSQQRFCLEYTVWYTIFYTLALVIIGYHALPAQLKPIFWRSFFCRDARSQFFLFFWRELQTHQAWKSAQKQDFAILAPKLPHAFMQELRPASELWGSLPWPQKFLIIAPAVLFYIYSDVIPNVRRLRRIYVRWRNMA